jgi:2-succinyl-6-hydroxy-2,4-cyclohexadiene-1-carboxylate synthase
VLHRVVDQGPGAPVVLVHGFTQTAASMGPLAARLARRHRLVRVDLPGHGGSGAVRAGFEAAARLLGEAGGRAAYLGYSLGGRLCLRLALDRPDLVRALLLLGASPGIADPAERAARRRRDEALAAAVERDGVAAFLDRWLAGPLFATLPRTRAGVAARLANRPAGLAAALRDLGAGAQAPLWERLAELACPALFLAGELDDRFAAVAQAMAAAVPAGELALIPGAGHAAHLERPAAVAARVERFLAAHPGATA